jgi:hypothetical protein
VRENALVGGGLKCERFQTKSLSDIIHSLEGALLQMMAPGVLLVTCFIRVAATHVPSTCHKESHEGSPSCGPSLPSPQQALSLHVPSLEMKRLRRKNMKTHPHKRYLVFRGMHLNALNQECMQVGALASSLQLAHAEPHTAWMTAP